VSDDLTRDALLGGRITFHQPEGGYRVAIDPLLLAAAVPAAARELVFDAGAGTGAASLCLAARLPGVRIVGLEIQRELQRIAALNARANGMEQQIDLMVGDLMRPPPRLTSATFDHVMTNPPYFEAGSATPPPEAGRARAHIEAEADLAHWLLACLRMLKPGGRLTMIHRPERLAAALATLHGRLGDLVVFPLWPGQRARPARRVLIHGRKGAGGPLRLTRGLVLHEVDGRYTPGAHAILYQGESLVLLPASGSDADG
jgi:tRNA1(Val) A37 N6-methylase TrmN6